MAKKFYSTRVLLNYSDFLDGIDDGCIMLCLDRAQVGIIQTLVSSYGLRNTNWVKEYLNDYYYEEPTPEEMALVENSIAVLIGGLQMSCDFGEIAISIQALASAYAEGCCSDGPGGSGGAGYEGEAPSENDTGGDTPPPGFDDWEEYLVYKCGLIEWLINQIEEDLDTLSGLSLVGLLFKAMTDLIGLTILTPVPGEALSGIVGAILTIVVPAPLWVAAKDIVSAIKESVACALFDARMAIDALSDVHNLIDEQVSGGGYGALVGPLAGTVVKAFFNQTAINMLFRKTNRNYVPTAGYCDSCCDSFLEQTEFVSFLKPDGKHYLYISAPMGCCYSLPTPIFSGYTFCGVECPMLIRFCGSPVGEVDETWTSSAEIYDYSGKCFQGLNMRSTTAFSVTVALTSCP